MDLEEFAALRAEFAVRGWHRKATGAVVAELLFSFALCITGYVMFLTCESQALAWLGMAISTYGTLGVTTNTHTSTHNGTSDKKWVNDLLSYIGYPLFANLSLTYWRHSHITVHHAAPNVMGIDADHDFTPWFVTTEAEMRQARGLARFYYRHLQKYFFPVILWVHVFLRQKSSWVFLTKTLLDPGKRRQTHWFDLVAMSLYWVAWVGIPSLFIPFSDALLASMVRIAFLGYPLFAVLAPAHYPHEAGCVRRGEWPKDFLALQTCTTVNFRTGPIGGFVCSGLQYQIEHHLFPNYSHVYYKRMSPHVRAFCERMGYPYRTMGWGEAILKIFAIFARPKPVAPDLETLHDELQGRSPEAAGESAA